MEEHLAAGVKPQRIGFISFTKKAANEARDRAQKRFGLSEKQLPFFKTIHALVFKQLALRRDSVLQWNHYRELGQKLGLQFTGRSMEIDGSLYGMGMGDRIMFIESLSRVKKQTLQKTWEDANEPDIDWWELELYARSLEAYKKNRSLLDYTDMLYLFASHGARVTPDLDVLFIDETQDCSPIQWDVLRILMDKVPLVYVAGDDDQCSVEGTKVLTDHGEIPVEQLDPSQHGLVCYDRSDGELRGFQRGFSFEIKKSDHHGPVVRVTVGDLSTQTTLDHIWLTRWSEDSKRSKLCVVYMMRRGGRFRVGWCQLFNSQKCFHLGIRAHHEKAEDAWILKVADDRTEASVWESIIATRYGIPTFPFEAVNGANHITPASIDRVFDDFPGVELQQRAISCLRAHGLNLTFPIWEQASTTKSGSRTFLCRGYNLISDLMEVPVHIRGKRVQWDWARIDREIKKTTVYGLRVEKHRNYVANGIVTHNCIYNWAGADVNQFLDLPGETQVLDQSYRVPVAIHKTALTLSSSIVRRQPKEWKAKAGAPGSIAWHSSPEEVDLSQGTWLLLARNGYMLAEYEEMCLRQGWSFASVGRSPLDAPSLKAILVWERLRGGKTAVRTEVESVLRFMSFPHLVQQIRSEHEDKPLTLDWFRGKWDRFLPDGKAPIWHEALDTIPAEEREYFIAARRRGETLTKTPRIAISTIHAAKGGEADNVLLLTDLSGKSFDQMLRNPDDEKRVQYVAITRAKENLHLVQPRTNMYFEL